MLLRSSCNMECVARIVRQAAVAAGARRAMSKGISAQQQERNAQKILDAKYKNVEIDRFLDSLGIKKVTPKELMDAYRDMNTNKLIDTQGFSSDPPAAEDGDDTKRRLFGSSKVIPAVEHTEWKKPSVWYIDKGKNITGSPVGQDRELEPFERDPMNQLNSRLIDRLHEHSQSRRKNTRPVASLLTDFFATNQSGITRRLIHTNRVSRMERAGRISHMTAAVVVGNGKGAVGFGYGKAKKRREAVIDATIKALQRMIPVDRYNDHTVFQEDRVKVGGTRLILRPCPPGHGLVCNEVLQQVCRMAGISDISINIHGRPNSLNMVKALIKGFLRQRTLEEVARAEGRNIFRLRRRMRQRGQHATVVDHPVNSFDYQFNTYPDIPFRSNWRGHYSLKLKDQEQLSVKEAQTEIAK